MVDQLGRWLRRRQGIERNPIYRLAADVAEGRLPAEAAYQAIERSSILNRLADGDLWELERETELAAADDPERALVLIRLTILAARYKGFDRVLVDSNVRAADLLERLGNERDQELHLREALHAAERIANVPGQRRALARLARLAYDRGDTTRARELLSRQLEAGREDADTFEEIETAILLGDLARSEGDPSGAREFYHRAARSAKRIGHYPGVVDALLRQIVILREEGQADAAVLLLQQAQDAAERTIDTRLQAEIAIQTGAVLSEHHQYQQACGHLLTALERARSAGDITLESRCLTGLARVEQRSGRFADAAEHFGALAELEQRLGNRNAAVRALSEAAEIRLELRDPNSALDALRGALPIAESLDEPALRQRVLGLLGLAYGALDRRSEAIEHLVAAVQHARQTGDLEQESRWLLGIGEVLLEFGEYDDAGAAARRALEIAREYGNARIESQALAMIGSISLARGLYRDAEESLQRALTLARQLEDTRSQLGYLQILAQLGSSTGQPQVAIRYLHQALDVAALHSGPETRSRLHGQLARLHTSLNQQRDAAEHYQSALAAAEEAEVPVLAARALRGLAAIQDASGDLDGSLHSYGRAAVLFEETGDLRNAAAAHYNVGAILHDRNEDEDARQHVSHALDLAMSAGDYAAADAARELLRWLAPAGANGAGQRWDEDLLLDEIAVPDESDRLPDAPRH